MNNNTAPEHFKVIDATWGSAAGLWWAYLWRSMLFVLVGVIIVSIVIGVIGSVLRAMTGLPLSYVSGFSGLVGFFGAFAIQIYILKRLMLKGFGGGKRLLIVEDKDEQVI